MLEYGALTSGIDGMIYSIRAWIDDAGPLTWVMITGVVLAGLFFWSRRR
jgi:hypothetical protein